MSLRDEIIARGWADDGTDTEWDEETTKDWEEKMKQPFPYDKERESGEKNNE